MRQKFAFLNIVLICGICLVALTYFYRFSINHSSNALEVAGKLSTLRIYCIGSVCVSDTADGGSKAVESCVISKKGIFDNTVKMGAVDYPVYVPTIFWKRRFLTIGVLSSASNFAERALARETWFNFPVSMKTENRKNRKSEDVDESSWGAFFIVGITGNVATDSLVREEAEKYQDIIILQVVEKYDAVMPKDYGDVKTDASFRTSYSVLPYKTHAFMQLSVSLSSVKGFVMKTDDDCFVDVPKVLALLREKENKENLYMGRCYPSKPQRDPKKRWYVSEKAFQEKNFQITVVERVTFEFRCCDVYCSCWYVKYRFFAQIQS